MALLFVGSLSLLQVTLLGVLYFVLLCYSLITAIRSEEGAARFLWTLIILFVPFVGVAAYMARHFLFRSSQA